MTVTSNTASAETTGATGVSALGAGVYVGGATVSITRSAIVRNTARSRGYIAVSQGAGINTNGGSLTVSDTTIAENVATALGTVELGHAEGAGSSRSAG